MKYTKEIRKLAEEASEYIIAIRRKIHAYPELGWEEFETAKLIRSELDSMGISWRAVGKTGTVATIPGKKGATVVALRADIDALPIQEDTGLSFSSKRNGIMHACGHDSHAAMLLGAAKILSALPERENEVRLIFQPAEEKGDGARGMIDGGCLEGVDAIYGSHVWPGAEAGKILLMEGPLMAGAAKFTIRVVGKGGHGSTPEVCDNPLPAVLTIAEQINQIKSLSLRGDRPVVVSIGYVQCGTAMNIIPNEGEISGTIRWFEREDLEKVQERIQEIAEKCAEMYHTKADVDMFYIVGCTRNDVDATMQAREMMVDMYGEQSIQKKSQLALGSEDFAYYGEDIPALFGFVGCSPEGCPYGVHNPHFLIDEGVLKNGSALYAAFAMEYKKT